MRLLTTVTVMAFLLTGCSEIRTNDPTDSYKYWAGAKPTDDIKVLNGQYWQSGNWTREYILYLQIKTNDEWWEEFVKQNHLQIDNDDRSKLSGSPDWFKPRANIKSYKHAEGFSDSRYFRDDLTGMCYIYEIQL